MFEITNDTELFRQFWLNERDRSPRWMADGNETWGCSWDDFKGFAAQCERVYGLDNTALLYVERIGNNANIHISILRGYGVNIPDLLEIRSELLQDYEMIFAWVGSHNRGLKRIVENCGLTFTGFKMYHGFTRKRLFEWHCYSIEKNNS